MNVYQALLRDGAAKRSLWKCEKCGAHAQDVTELVEALEQLARLGNGEHYGNSDGNMIARDALSKYKGAK